MVRRLDGGDEVGGEGHSPDCGDSPSRLALPSIFLANVRSLPYKIDDLNVRISTRKDYMYCCVYFITESWLDDTVPDQAVCKPTMVHRREACLANVYPGARDNDR